MKRTLPALLTALALVATALSMTSFSAPAAAAPTAEYEQFEQEYWFGRIELDHSVFNDDSHFLSLDLVHPERDYPLPFHSVLRGRLIDCKGRVAYQTYASQTSAKVGREPWRTRAGLSLNLPPKGGPFARWEVSLRSKGRKTLRWTITDGGSGFRLGCNGGYRRHKGLFWAPEYDAMRPLNAAFKKSPAQAMAPHIRSFGRISGRARVGAKLRAVGARDAQGRPSCGFGFEVTWPGRPALDADARGTMCDTWLEVPRTAYFRKHLKDGSRRFVKAPARGKDLTVSVNFHVRGHDYMKITPLGRIR